MKIVAGLGNPGGKYQFHRHNAGFLLVDLMSSKLGVAFEKSAQFNAELAKTTLGGVSILFVKPLTFMNLSGKALAPLSRYFKVEPKDLALVYDDLDLAKGIVKMRLGGGHGGHNGVRSTIEDLGSAEFTRIKVGIGRPEKSVDGSHNPTPADWVLSNFSDDEAEALRGSVLDQVWNRLEDFLKA